MGSGLSRVRELQRIFVGRQDDGLIRLDVDGLDWELLLSETECKLLAAALESVVINDPPAVLVILESADSPGRLVKQRP